MFPQLKSEIMSERKAKQKCHGSDQPNKLGDNSESKESFLS
jgi:hypothetical protein